MHTLHFIYRALVAVVIALLVAQHYAPASMALPFWGAVNVPAYVYWGVAAAALIMPAFWALTHLCGGVLFGLAAGGLLDGLKLGLILGLGMALSKCWPYALGVAGGVYLGGGPLLYVVAGVGAAVVLFGLDKALQYFWNSTRQIV
jgi:hypothetical protein